MRLLTRKQKLSTYFGNLFEHYDTALFGLLSPFLAPLIFPKHDPLSALILTYAIIPLSMLARPLGSLFFGYIGDRYGRTQALFFTLAGMALVSMAIALSPTFAQAGLWAPLCFCLGKALQNFCAAGETMGGAILLLENSGEKRHDIISGFYSAAAMGGHLLAALGVALLGQYEGGWRWLYLFGGITALFALQLRRAAPTLALPASIPFAKTLSDLKQAIWECRISFILIVLCAGFAHANYAIALILINGLTPLVTPFSKTEAMQMNTLMLLLDFALLPVFGYVASKISREKLMMMAALAIALLALPLMAALQGASWLTLFTIRTLLVIFGVAFFAPFHAWAQQLIPPRSRYAVISLGYALGSQCLGSPTATLALYCYQKTGLITSIAWYWLTLAIGCTLVLFLRIGIKKGERIDIGVKKGE